MSFISSISSIIFPGECPICKKALVKGEKLFCTSCLYDFPWADPDLQIESRFIQELPAEAHPDKIYSLFYYNKGAETKQLLFAIKYHNKPQLAYKLGLMLGEHIKEHLHADALIPTPLHSKRLKERGYNQAEELAKGISKICGIPIINDVLYRDINTATQTDKDIEARYATMSQAFKIKNQSKIVGKHLVIIDDVITTGATIGACLRTLNQVAGTTFTLVCVARTSL